MKKNRIIEKKWIWLNSVIFLLFLALSFLMNWSLLIGENLMKWDIWSAEYPSQVLMSEAIANHTLPLWNPLMRYGVPNYSVIGTPIWYPITLILACIGYTPVTIAICYALHIAIGGFGMYLLAKQELEKNGKVSLSGYCASFLSGCLYCGSGIFLSNAQHIMIIISVAWIPYVFWFMRSYLGKKKLVFAFGAGFFASQLLLGGYPEIFLDLFIFLIPYTLYFGFCQKKTVLRNVIVCVGKYVLVCVFTVLAGAIIVIPFLHNMNLITRGNGIGQIPNGYSPITYLSFLFPQMTNFITGYEKSMVNYYIGIGTILLFPMMLVKKYKNKNLYFCMAAVALLLCMGENSFLHTLLYRFFPMYSNFRFPTLNRVFIAIFILLLLAVILKEVLETGGVSRWVIFFNVILITTVLLMGGLAAVVGNINSASGDEHTTKITAFAESAIRLGLVLFAYFLIFYSIYKRQISYLWRHTLIIGLVVVEILNWSFWETPITVSSYYPGEYLRNQETKEKIDKEFEKFNNRIRGVNFAGHTRSTSWLNSKKIVFNQTFDEEGYCSFLLSSTESFKQTYFRNIIEQNPEVYFTNHVVTPADSSYEDWVNRCDNEPEQIYVAQGLSEDISSYHKLVPNVISQEALSLVQTEQGFQINGVMSAENNRTGRIRLYWSDKISDTISMELIFINDEGVQQPASGEFVLTEDGDIIYTDIYFPSIETEYQQVQVITEKFVPIKAELVKTERMASDGVTNLSWFGFNSIQMTVDAPTEGYVTILQSKHDGWTAYIDGKPVEISLVNNSFMGIHVTAGKHAIIMKFRPQEWFIGGVLSALYWVTATVMLVGYWKKKKYMQKAKCIHE